MGVSGDSEEPIHPSWIKSSHLRTTSSSTPHSSNPTGPFQNPHTVSYWGIIASCSFCFIARHFAKHYIWEVDAVSPVAFRFAGHTFWVGGWVGGSVW